MRYIEELRDLHKNKEIWVIGSGPSVDDFPNDFFDDKISIALNETGFAFPNCTYIHSCDIPFSKGMKDKPELGKCIFVHRPGIDWGDLPVVMRFSGKRAIREDFELVAKCIMLKGDCCYLTRTTIAHTAIQAAVVMGAKKVTLVGCEARAMKDRSYSVRSGGKLRVCSEEEQKGTSVTFAAMREGVQWLAEALPGIEIARYYYKDIPEYGVKKGYEIIGGANANQV